MGRVRSYSGGAHLVLPFGHASRSGLPWRWVWWVRRCPRTRPEAVRRAAPNPPHPLVLGRRDEAVPAAVLIVAAGGGTTGPEGAKERGTGPSTMPPGAPRDAQDASPHDGSLPRIGNAPSAPWIVLGAELASGSGAPRSSAAGTASRRHEPTSGWGGRGAARFTASGRALGQHRDLPTHPEHRCTRGSCPNGRATPEPDPSTPCRA